MEKKCAISAYYLTISDEYATQRIDNFLVTHLKSVPKTRVYRIIRKGEVRINKKRVQPSYRLQIGDKVRIPPLQIENKQPLQLRPSLAAALADSILYEDKGLMIINKPAGYAVHGGTGVPVGVVEGLRLLYPTLPHLELAHRLDADTSGCLILCKKRSVLRQLHELMRAGQVKKLYWALTAGLWLAQEMTVDAPLLKNQLSSGERIVKVNKAGKVSLTVFKTLQTFADAMLVEARLHTGRTHQIRVHAQYRNHPIAGDEKYGDKVFNKNVRDKGLKRMFLHAHAVEFTLPLTQQLISVSAPLPLELKDCLARYAETGRVSSDV